MTLAAVQPSRFSRSGVVMKPNAAVDQRGRLKSRVRDDCATARCSSIRAWWRPETFRASARSEPRNAATARSKSSRAATRSSRRHPTNCARARRIRLRGSARDVRRRARQLRDGVRRVRPARARSRHRRFRRRLALGAPRIDSLPASEAPFADKDAAFFPEPVASPAGVESLAFYHRPTLPISVQRGESALSALEVLPPGLHEGIAIGYIPLAAAKPTSAPSAPSPKRTGSRCRPRPGERSKSAPERRPCASRRLARGDPRRGRAAASQRRCAAAYCAGVIVHDATRLDRIIFRSHEPLFVPEAPGEIHGTVGNVVFPTGIDPRGERAFDIYYGMADYEIGRGRLAFAS